MISRWKWREPQPARHLSTWAIVLGAVIVLGIGVAAFTVLLWRYGGLDAIRTASAITVAAGGAAALLLAARRQRSTEQTLEHQREVAAAAERDAAEQRITELYTRAVDQLGAEKAPVRLGGLHALERLAQNNPPQRQTIVDVICAYLRMPYTCQGSVGTARRRTRDLPGGGHGICPVAAMGSAQWRPPPVLLPGQVIGMMTSSSVRSVRSVRVRGSSPCGQVPPVPTRRQNRLQSGQRRSLT